MGEGILTIADYFLKLECVSIFPDNLSRFWAFCLGSNRIRLKIKIKTHLNFFNTVLACLSFLLVVAAMIDSTKTVKNSIKVGGCS